MVVLIIIIIVVLVILFSKKKSNVITTKANIPTDRRNSKSPGMCFMEMYEMADKERRLNTETISSPYYEHLLNWYWTIALACQGRITELDDIYEDIKSKECELHEQYKSLLKAEKKQLYAMARIAQRIEDSNMSDMKTGESIGEYTDRKLLKSKTFMEKYQYYLNFDFKSFYNKFDE